MTTDPGTDPDLPADARPEYEVSPRYAASRHEGDNTYLILDCRLPSEIDVASIDGAECIPLHELEARLDEVEDALEDRGLPKDAPFAVLCHHGQRSLRATLLLQRAGFSGARSVYGGIEFWARTVNASIPRYTRNGADCSIVQ